MALGEKHPDTKITLVRGADGALYLISDVKAPVQLSEEQKREANGILKEAGVKLTDILKGEEWFTSLSCTSHVGVALPEVFL